MNLFNVLFYLYYRVGALAGSPAVLPKTMMNHAPSIYLSVTMAQIVSQTQTTTKQMSRSTERTQALLPWRRGYDVTYM